MEKQRKNLIFNFYSKQKKKKKKWKMLMSATKIMIPFYETSAIKYGTTGMNYVT